MISEAAHAECVRLLELLTNPRVQESWSWVFMTPVDIAGYDQVVKRPMDLGTIKKNLGSKPSRCRFKSHEKFARDVRLVFHNALLYNKQDQDVKGSVYAAAQHLLRVFETAYAKAIDSVFRADDATAAAAKAAHREAKEEKRKAEGGGDGDGRRDGEAVGSSSSSSHHHHSSSSSHNSSSSSLHHHREEGEEGSKHKHKHSKKEKKSKKSKKKSKDRERDREHRHSSSSSGESKKKSHRSEHESGAVASSSSVIPTKESSKVVERSAERSATPAIPVSAVPQSSSSVMKRESTSSSAVSGAKMSDSEVTACLTVLMKLIKYKEGAISPAAPFLQPVDLTHFPDYRIKVPNRMHLYGVQKKLRSGSYATIDAFAYDMRLIFSNCLVYNSDVILSKVMRNHAVTLMKLFEGLFVKIGGSWPGVPERWKCHQILQEILAHRTDGQETAQWFKYPIESYYDSPDQIPYNYYKTVKEPMDIGTVSSRLHLGEYKHVSEFIAGMKLVFDNCIRYWKPDPQGQTYCESAETLLRVLHTRSATFGSSASSSSATSKDKHRSSSSSSSKVKAISATTHSSSAQLPPAPVVTAPGGDYEKVKKKSSSKSSKSSKSRESTGGLPEKDICLGIMKQLRSHKMKGFRGVEIKTAGPFLTAVNTTKYPDYLTIVSEPMDFAKIERKLKSDRYGSVDEFSADVHLIFSNCHKYNSDPVEGADIRAMATNLRNYFVELCNEKLGPLDGMVNGPTHTPTHSAQAASVSSASATKPKTAPPPARVASEPKVHSSTAAMASSSSQKPVKKSPAPSPTKRPLPTSSATTSSGVTSARDPKREVEPVISRKLPKSEPAVTMTATPVATMKPATQVKTTSVPAPTTFSSVAPKELPPDSTTNVAGLTPEEAKRLRKEMKEKRKKEKKEKKEKKKKKDKEKKRDKKDKKERSKSSSSAQEAGLGALPSSSTTAPVPLSSTTPAATHTLAPPAPASASAARPLKSPPTVPSSASPAIASKRGLVEPHVASSSASSKKSKKQKKSDLSSWEAACDRVLNRLSKIEQVAKLHFNHPLLEVFPQLASEYTSLIAEPMDLRTLREQLHAHGLTQAEFLRKGRLIFQNAVKFNCADDPASIQVRDMSAHLMWYFDSLCAELQIVPAPELSGEQSRAKRNQLRRERAEFVNTVPVELKAKECQKLLRVLNSQKHDKNCWPFRKPVRVLFPALSADYFEIIKTPMDLTTIAEKLNEFEYKAHGEFIRDVRLTFENAMIYNRADKDREGWSVYSAAVHMLSVVEDLWGDVTLEVTEKTRRRELLRKERVNDAKRKRSDTPEVGGEREKKIPKHHHHSSADSESGHKHHHKHHHKSSKVRSSDGGAVAAVSSSQAASAATPSKSAAVAAPVVTATSVVGTVVVGGGNGSREDASASDATATRVKLQLMPSRPNMERMNKQERKAEEKRRKRARREEEMARTEKRRRTAVAATDDALREAEIRSRRKLQKQEMAEAVRLREERERRATEEEAERARRAQMKLNAAAWTGVLLPATGAASNKRTGFWAKKHTKLQIPAAFQPPAINA